MVGRSFDRPMQEHLWSACTDGKNGSAGRELFREGSQGPGGRALPMWGVKKKRSMAVRRTNATFTCHHLKEDEGPSHTKIRTMHEQTNGNEFLYPTGAQQSQFQRESSDRAPPKTQMSVLVMSDRDPAGKSVIDSGWVDLYLRFFY